MDSARLTGVAGSVAAAPGCRIIPFAFPGLPTVGCAFSTALAGNLGMGHAPDDDAGAPANRRRVLRGLGLERWVELKQVHGDLLLPDPEPTSPDAPSGLEGDGAFTRERDLALLIKTADCQPLLLAGMNGAAVAALHVGWRGNAVNFPASGLARFCVSCNLHPSEVLAVRGPSLGPGAAEFVNFDREWPPEFLPWFDRERRRMDLWRLTRDQLVRAGMLPEHIFSLDLCSYSLPELFFSHRRGHSGRQGSFIWLKGLQDGEA